MINPIVEDFERTIKKLEEVLILEKTEIIRDSAIKRFDLCFDLSWKSIKSCARQAGVECNSPRACFRTAFQLELIEYDEQWLEMIKDRNLTAHLYKEEYADQVYVRLPEYLDIFKVLLTKLKRNQ